MHSFVGMGRYPLPPNAAKLLGAVQALPLASGGASRLSAAAGGGSYAATASASRPSSTSTTRTAGAHGRATLARKGGGAKLAHEACELWDSVEDQLQAAKRILQGVAAAGRAGKVAV